MFFDPNYLFFYLTVALSVVSLVSGALLVVKGFFSFRTEISRSLNMDLDVIRVVKEARNKEGENDRQELWKEEIGAMEQLLTSLSMLREKKGLWHRFFYGSPHISFEIANSADSEEIVFFVAVPKKYRESVEKQIHSFSPNASLEKTKDYNIFFPGSFTQASVLQLKNKY
ncbi:MAG: hypothetical protein CO139_03835, partial [Candidatus Moranbacteria bacterium CG_4_9_14_3_um_filter_36_9]